MPLLTARAVALLIMVSRAFSGVRGDTPTFCLNSDYVVVTEAQTFKLAATSDEAVSTMGGARPSSGSRRARTP